LIKKSKIPEEKFQEHFDALVRVLTFVKGKEKIYKRPEWEDAPHSPFRSHIFLCPGKHLTYPDDVQAAKAEFCPDSEDAKTMIKFGELEGRGGFGRVFAGKLKNPKSSSDKSLFAIKLMPHKTDKEIRMNFNELGYLRYCAHPNVVKYHRSYLHDNEELWLLMEFLEGGTLSQATANFQFSESHIAYVAREMLKGIAFLHSANIAHRDLKSANVMLSMKAEIKLIDFGLSADFSEVQEEVHTCGSPYWMPPEMIMQQPHSLPVDIWSFGVCLVEMINREVPNRTSRFKALFLVASEGLHFSKEEHKWSSDFHDLVAKCLQYNPRDRPTAAQLLEHPFLKHAAPGKEMQRIMPAIFLSNTMTKQGIL